MTATVIATVIFSLPDAFKYLISPESFENVKHLIPLANYGLGWVIPAFVAFMLAYLFQNFIQKKAEITA